MSDDISLKLDERTVTGKKVASLRKEGLVPSVVYGATMETAATTQSPVVETTKVAHSAGKHTPVNLTIGGKKQLAIIKSLDFDPVKRMLRHVSFQAISQNEVIETQVPVHLVGMGESLAEKGGLVILQAIEHVDIKAKPADLPESLEVSVLELATPDDKLTISNIKLPKGVEFADLEQDMDLVIANVYEPAALQAANEAAGGDAEDESAVEAENGAEAAAEAPAEEAK